MTVTIENNGLTHENIYSILDKEDNGYFTAENVNLILSSINDYMINEITSNNPLDTSFEDKFKSSSDYILQKLFVSRNNELDKIERITKSDYFEFYQKNSAIEALRIKIKETNVYILKKYDLNITKNNIYNRVNTVRFSLEEHESLIMSMTDSK